MHVAIIFIMSALCTAAIVVMLINARMKDEVGKTLRMMSSVCIVAGILAIAGITIFLKMYW